MKEFLSITSKDNSLVKLVCQLQSSSKARRENNLFVLEGLRICDDACENGIVFEKLIVSDSAVGKYAEEIDRFSDSAVQCIRVPDSIFKKMSDTTEPQGILGVVAMPDNGKKPSDGGRYIGLENLNDPSNLGAVARTAEALGVSGIILSKGSCDPFGPKALRASMGTLLRVPLYIVDDICETAKAAGLRSIACVVERNAKPVSQITFKDGDLLLIGNEANGLSEKTRENSDLRITIPMCGRAESLNAAAAAAIVMWEMMK